MTLRLPNGSSGARAELEQLPVRGGGGCLLWLLRSLVVGDFLLLFFLFLLLLLFFWVVVLLLWFVLLGFFFGFFFWCLFFGGGGRLSWVLFCFVFCLFVCLFVIFIYYKTVSKLMLLSFVFFQISMYSCTIPPQTWRAGDHELNTNTHRCQ